ASRPWLASCCESTCRSAASVLAPASRLPCQVATPVLAPKTIIDMTSRNNQKLVPTLPSLPRLAVSGAVLMFDLDIRYEDAGRRVTRRPAGIQACGTAATARTHPSRARPRGKLARQSARSGPGRYPRPAPA